MNRFIPLLVIAFVVLSVLLVIAGMIKGLWPTNDAIRIPTVILVGIWALVGISTLVAILNDVWGTRGKR